ncbi:MULTISPECIES: NIPSNAP family protein [unclassified Rhizobium]|uniref:NIPSNAP family protein n=1 Tax=unclassified Rhizobium TaxID=2613769 RepID=UPI001AD9B5BB|nr:MULTISPECIES: NIPSNAP family protein [unclassified Rhizobium]MBO9123985.1 NIPSNAP family protein [Rhizobium sp. 16-488-2b]MBO9174517.1 NIPSNAP family protein [Rhizobium sp. 16-488-2a]
MIYDLTILSLLPNTLGAVMPVLPETYANFSSTGTPLGAFACEFGTLNRFAFLTAYETIEALTEERARLMTTADPYGIAASLAGVTNTAFKPLSFAKPITPGAYGPFYEFRTYTLAPNGLAETEEAWAKIIERRHAMSPLLTNMASIEEGPQKMVHIWPYQTIEARVAARAQASKEGIWPPPGGSAKLTNLQSELFVATSFSDLK